jgi:hypothetical protein
MPRQEDDAIDLLRLKRLRQDVIAAQVEHFRPEFVVSQPRCDDEVRRYRQTVESVEHDLPVAVRQISLADHDCGVVVAEVRESFTARGHSMEKPVGLLENMSKRNLMFRLGTDQENLNAFGRVREYL